MIKQTSCRIPFSFRKTCLFLLLFVFLAVFFVGVLLLCVFVVLKPQMPEFSLQDVSVESYKLSVSSQDLMVSSVFSLNLSAENPNKIGLSYDSSRFHVLSQGLVVGLIRIPQFHQPPSSKNVSIKTRVLFESVNVSEILQRKDGPSLKSAFDIRILGYIRARVRILNITMPKIKIGLDCDFIVNKSYFSLSDEAHAVRWTRNHLISLPLNPQTVSKKCSLAILL